MSKAIVTGSNGFIGFNLCKELKRQGWRVVGVDDLSAGLAENVVDGFRYVRLKVQDREAIAELIGSFRPSAIFHLAAVPRVAYSVENPTITTEANVLGMVSLLEGIVKGGLVDHTRFVFSGSSSVYGGAEQRPTPEDHPCHPQSPYALQKLQDEQWLKLFAELYGLDGVTLRYFNVFGPGSLFGGAYSTVLSAWMYHQYVKPEYQPFLEGDGQQSRDFCYVDNAVKANLLAATRPNRFKGQAINIAQGQAHTLLQCKSLLEEIAGKTFSLEMRDPRVGDVAHTLADISLAKKELGYEPDADFKAQLSTTADWYKSSYPAAAETE